MVDNPFVYFCGILADFCRHQYLLVGVSVQKSLTNAEFFNAYL